MVHRLANGAKAENLCWFSQNVHKNQEKKRHNSLAF